MWLHVWSRRGGAGWGGRCRWRLRQGGGSAKATARPATGWGERHGWRPRQGGGPAGVPAKVGGEPSRGKQGIRRQGAGQQGARLSRL